MPENMTGAEKQLNDFDSIKRKEALDFVVRMLDEHKTTVPSEKNEVNLHFHTFYSYNANGWSPSRIAWESKKYGLMATGIVDFDVIDGMNEFLLATHELDIRGAVSLETRVFIEEYRDHVLSSPKEPGVAYFMAVGCYQYPETDSKADHALKRMRTMASQRNIEVMDRVNEYLVKVKIDYHRDALPLTPSGNATERHMLSAYDKKAREVFSDDKEALVSFWANALEMDKLDCSNLIDNTAAFHDKIRSKLMKYGGVGYVAPTKDTFPQVEEVIAMSNDMGAIPAIAWLDGTNSGEADMPKLLGDLAEMGTLAMNIIPDRNWNIKDADEKKTKVENLEKAVNAAREANFPIIVGTEMNKAGLPFVDDFDSPELRPYVKDFIDGANFLHGHTMLAKPADLGVQSEWAKSAFSSASLRNDFYTKVGSLAGPKRMSKLIGDTVLSNMSPDDILKMMSSNSG